MPVIVNDAIIGNHVRSARKAKKLSQSACAALMNISVSYFGRIERGVVRLNLERLIEKSAICWTYQLRRCWIIAVKMLILKLLPQVKTRALSNCWKCFALPVQKQRT